VARAFSSTAAPGGAAGDGGTARGRGRGKGALSVYMEANRAVVEAFTRGGGGPMPASSPPAFGGKGGGGGKGGRFQGKGGGRGDGARRRPDGGKGGRGGGAAARQYEGAEAVGKAQVFSGFRPGQFEDVEGGEDAMMEALIDATMDAPNGCLVFDYEATDAEKAALVAAIDQSAPRGIEELLAYNRLEAAIGG